MLPTTREGLTRVVTLKATLIRGIWQMALESEKGWQNKYGDGKKGMQILFSISCLVLPAVVKQQQEDISHNHIQALFAISVLLEIAMQCSTVPFSPSVSSRIESR